MNRSFQIFGEENVGKFTVANISYFSEYGIWLGKILENNICFAKFAKVFLARILHYTVYVVFKVCSIEFCGLITR